MHDAVAHSVSVMVLQAGAAEQVLATAPERARESLVTIQDTGREAIVELRRMLGLLRDPVADASLAPQPSVDRLDALLEQVRAAGLPVELTVEGEPRRLPPGIDRSAYRIVQEGLTNALKHAGPAHASVRLRYGERALELEVLDDGRGPASASGGGFGLLGMRERAALYGGVLAARRATGRRLCAERPPAARAGGLVIRVLIADDEALVRGGLRMILEAQPDIEIAGEADDGRAALELAARSHPDVVLMDIRMPGLDGLEATRRLLASAAPAPRVLILTTFDLDEYVYEALRAGASGFLLKSARPPELIAAVRAAVAGDTLLAPEITRRLVESYVRRPTARDPPVARARGRSPHASSRSSATSPAGTPTPRSPGSCT